MNTTKTSIIRPGILVALKSSVSGGVKYSRVNREARIDEEGQAVAEWETTRVITDPEEHERATKVRSAALGLARDICSPTTFGLLCPMEREGELDAALAQARALIAEHNAVASCTKVAIFVLKGRIAATDEEAAKAIGAEVQALIAQMNEGIDRMDVEAIRKAAKAAQDMAAMLSEEKQAAVEGAIEAARRAARQIVKRVEKQGEQAAVVLADIQRGGIERARIAFLDLDTGAAPAGEAMPSVDMQRLGDLDLGEGPSSDRAPEATPAADGAVL
jgi:hypothetical protein